MKTATAGTVINLFKMAFLLAALLPLQAGAQKIAYSAPDKTEARQTNFEIIGRYQQNFLIYKNFRSDNRICVYDQDMKLLDQHTLSFMPERTIEASFVTYPDFIYMFYQYMEKNVVHLMAVKLGPDGKNLTQPIALDTTVVGGSNTNKVYSVLSSDDKNHLLIFRINTRFDKKYVFKTMLFDRELTLRYTTPNLGLDMAARNDFLTDFNIDNEGNLVFGKGVRLGTNDNISKFFLIIKPFNKDQFVFRELQLENVTLDEVKLKLDNYNNRYLFTGFYYPGRKLSIEGIVNAVFDKASNEWVVRNTIPLNDQLREDARGANNIRNAFNDYYIHEITIRSDGAFLLNAECTYQTNRGPGSPYNRWDMMNPWMSPMDYYRWGGWGGWGWNSPWGMGMPWGPGVSPATRHHADNVMVLAFDKNGKMLLSNLINKAQFDDNGSNSISYSMINTGNGLQYLYNENESRRVVLAYQTFTPEGRIIRNPTLKSLERDYRFLPRFAKQVERTTVIIPCMNRNLLCFARLEFPN